MPARVHSSWPVLQSGPFHQAAHDLAVLVVVELEFHRQQFFIPSRATSIQQSIYHDWVVAMAYSGASTLSGWWINDEAKVERINKRAAAFRRRVQRFATARDLGKEVGGANFAADLYFAAIGTLVDDGIVSRWVRRRDGQGGTQKQAALRGELSSRDMYWYEKLKFSHLGPSPGAVDTQSGLPMTVVLEVLRRTRFCGPDAMPQAD